MDFSEYQHKAARTLPQDKSDMELASNLGMGLAGEAGELVDYMKKVHHHGHPVDLDHVEEEIGDLLWYVSMICEFYGLSTSRAARRNVEQKLANRYPDGFDEERSINREL